MLDIELSMLISTLVVFLILIALLNSTLYIPMFNYMKKRDDDIKKDLDEVSGNDDEVALLEKQAKEIMDQAKLDVFHQREQIVADAKAAVASKVAAKKEELAASFSSFEQELHTERGQLKSSLLSQIPLYREAIKAKVSQI